MDPSRSSGPPAQGMRQPHSADIDKEILGGSIWGCWLMVVSVSFPPFKTIKSFSFLHCLFAESGVGRGQHGTCMEGRGQLRALGSPLLSGSGLAVSASAAEPSC